LKYETSLLPREPEEPTLADDCSSDEHAIQVDTTSSQPPVADDTASQYSTATIRQRRNAEHTHWKLWQEWFLALEAFKLESFKGESGKKPQEGGCDFGPSPCSVICKFWISPIQISSISANRAGYARRRKSLHSAMTLPSFTLVVEHWIHNMRFMILTN